MFFMVFEQEKKSDGSTSGGVSMSLRTTFFCSKMLDFEDLRIWNPRISSFSTFWNRILPRQKLKTANFFAKKFKFCFFVDCSCIFELASSLIYKFDNLKKHVLPKDRSISFQRFSKKSSILMRLFPVESSKTFFSQKSLYWYLRREKFCKNMFLSNIFLHDADINAKLESQEFGVRKTQSVFDREARAQKDSKCVIF